MPQIRPPRAVRAIQMQAQLADALAGVEVRATQASAAATPKPPVGMRFLIPPHELVSIREPHGGGADALALRLAFARFVLWRILHGNRRPTKASVTRTAWRLRALALWRLALRQHARGGPLPVQHGKEVPAYAVAPTLDAAAAAHHAHKQRRSVADPSETRADDYGGPDSAYDGDIPPEDLGAFYDEATGEYLPIDDTLEFWARWGDIADLPADDLVDLTKLLPPDLLAMAGQSLRMRDLLSAWIGAGLSDLQIAGMIDWSFNAQTSLWAGASLTEAASASLGGAGLFGTFDIRDPYFYDYLRNQTGYLIKGIGDAVGPLDYTRRDIAETMWHLLGGEGGPGLSVEAIARYLGDQFYYDLAGQTRFSADWRAYMISVTETARAEGFGEFAAMWRLGVQQKQWLVTSGACQICVGNAEAGGIPLQESYPSGVVGPPAHPICRCSSAPLLSDTFRPDDWVSRDMGPLDQMMFNWQGAAWPAVDLSELNLDFDAGDFGPSDVGLAAQPDVTRAGAAVTHDPSHKQQQQQRASIFDHAPAVTHDITTARRLAERARTLSEQWARHAHIRLPQSEAEMRQLVRRLRSPAGHDELPDLREADEHYIVALRETAADVLGEKERK